MDKLTNADSPLPKATPFADPQGARVDYGDGLVTETPSAAAPAEAKVDKAAAQAKGLAAAFGPDLTPGTPRVYLRLVSLNTTAASTAGAQSLPAISKRLAWVLLWDGSTPRIGGGSAMSAKTRADIVSRIRCLFIVTIDAQTGDMLDSRQVCGAKD